MDYRARWIAVSVEVFDHEILHGDPYSRRDAWLWLIANAAWKDHETRTRGGVIRLRRGEVLAGLEHLAETWDWSVKRVRTFLRDLVAARMIEKGQARTQYAAVYLLTKYDTYQTAAAHETRAEAGEGQTKGTREAREGQHSTKNTKDTSISLGQPDCLTAFDDYNELAAAHGLPRASKLTDDRKRAISRVLADFGLDGWQKMLANVPQSPHLMGDNDRGWKCDLDFLTNPKKFSRVLDGGYLARRVPSHGRSARPVSSAIDDIKAIAGAYS